MLTRSEDGLQVLVEQLSQGGSHRVKSEVIKGIRMARKGQEHMRMKRSAEERERERECRQMK